MVQIEVTGDTYGTFKLFWAPGQKVWMDELQAKELVDADVAKIIQRHEKPAIPDIKLSKR